MSLYRENEFSTSLGSFLANALIQTKANHEKDPTKLIDYDHIVHPHIKKYFDETRFPFEDKPHFNIAGAYPFSQDLKNSIFNLYSSGFFTRVDPYDGLLYLRKTDDTEKFIENERKKMPEEFQMEFDIFVDHLGLLVVEHPYDFGSPKGLLEWVEKEKSFLLEK